MQCARACRFNRRSFTSKRRRPPPSARDEWEHSLFSHLLLRFLRRLFLLLGLCLCLCLCLRWHCCSVRRGYPTLSSTALFPTPSSNTLPPSSVITDLLLPPFVRYCPLPRCSFPLLAEPVRTRPTLECLAMSHKRLTPSSEETPLQRVRRTKYVRETGTRTARASKNGNLSSCLERTTAQRRARPSVAGWPEP